MLQNPMKNSTESPQSCSTEYDCIDETHSSPTTSLLPSKAGHENAIEKIGVNINLHQPNLSSSDGDCEYLVPTKAETILATETTKISVDKDFRIRSENIQMLKRGIASGNSAYVHLANYTRNAITIKVAVKILKPNCRKGDTLEEIKLLSSCKHENIVTFVGWMEPPEVVKFNDAMETSDEQMGIITEYMGGGDLHTYLINNENRPTINKIFAFTFQVFNAMIYLHDKGIIHRDLAARNCLLNENYEILKLNDFGISRETDTNGVYKQITLRKLPLCWLPLETLLDPSIFTRKGDIWAFGVLLWEMYQRGKQPYGAKDQFELKQLLTNGERLSKPEYCHEVL
uniref:Protein kinase domain-containing protein n=1 Tax=Panagrolaimus davidi TaxID=227884 RepID=A0A914QRE3_9BILA